jgi:hypothetical protein
VLRERIAIEGVRLSYRQNCESMRRVHISPVIGKRNVASIKPEDVERLASRMLAKGSSPKTVRNVMTFYDLTAAMWDIAPRGREFIRLRALLTERFRGELRLARQPHGLERA